MPRTGSLCLYTGTLCLYTGSLCLYIGEKKCLKTNALKQRNVPTEMQVKKEMLKKKFANEKDIEKINKEIIDEIKNAADYALNSQYPKDSELYTDVYI